jgi:predicted P-loop ATPase
MSEMEVTRRSDANALKAFISRQTDKARLAYQRLAAEFPRQCVFIGTINPDADGAWLKDDTGNRRFWPVLTTGQINVRGIKAVRNQLFAEAVEYLEKGEKLFMEDKNLNELAQKEAAQRHAVHPWAEQIGNWLSSPELQKGDRPFITAREVYLEALGGIDKQLGRKETLSIAVCMKHLGWIKTVKARPGLPAIRGYKAPMSEKEMTDLLGDLI